jgi:DNA-directed RNA polymerase specialized sigma24 family protein
MTQIRNYVIKNRGDENESKEIFHNSIVQFFQNMMKRDVNDDIIDKEAYIFTIAKNLYKAKNKQEIHSTDLAFFETLPVENIEVENADSNTYKLAEFIYRLSTDTCKQVLMLWSENHTMTEIAKLMAYKSEGMARKKKYECLQKIMSYFKENPKLYAQYFCHE